MTTLAQAGVSKTLSDLKTDIAAWLNRSDLGERIPLFIALAEAEFDRDVYWDAVTALTDATPTNWLLSAAYDAYLYGACKHGSAYLRDAEGAMGYQQLRDAAIAALSMSDNSGAPSTVESLALPLDAAA